MGMDLIARKRHSTSATRKLDSLHFNWWAWGYFGNLLIMLGADVSEMSGSNDGYYIKAATCRDWAKRLESLSHKFVCDRTLSEPNPISGRPVELTRCVFFESEKDAIIDGFSDGRLRRWTKSDYDWLKSVINFFKNCGGCRQF